MSGFGAPSGFGGTPSFGQNVPSSFGGFNSSANHGGFSSGGFGMQSQTFGTFGSAGGAGLTSSSRPGFGNASTNSSASEGFGQPGGFGLARQTGGFDFGSVAFSSSGGFGKPVNTAQTTNALPSSTGTTGFGVAQVGGGFGSSQTGFENPANSFGGFGNQVSTSTSGFGGNTSGGGVIGGGSGSFGNASVFGGRSLNPNAQPFQPLGAARGAPGSLLTTRKKVEPSNSLFIKFAPGQILPEQQIRDYFSKFGRVENVSVRPNGSCYVQMATVSEAQNAMNVQFHPNGMNVRWNQFATAPNQWSTQGSVPMQDDDLGAVTSTDRFESASKSELDEKQIELNEKKAALEAKIAAKKAATAKRPKSPKQKPSGDGQSTNMMSASSGTVVGMPFSKHVGISSRPASPLDAAPSQPSDHRNGFVVGTCTLMCPLSETQKRMQANQVELLEMPNRELPELGDDPEKLTIMKFQRSAAAETMSVPELIRTPAALDQTANYMWMNILDRDEMGPDPRYRDSNAVQSDRPNLLTINNFVMDRMKRMVQEYGMQGFSQEGGPLSLQAMKVFEECARCHIILAYEMHEIYNKGEGFSERLHNESLNNTLKKLLEMYKRSSKSGTVSSECEPEFQAYYMLLQLNAKEESSNLIVQEIYNRWRSSSIVSIAKKVYEAFYSGDYFTFFQMFRTAPYVFACLLRRGLDRVRRVGLCHLNGSTAMGTMFPLSRFEKLFCFDNQQDAREFCEKAGISVVPSETGLSLRLGDQNAYNHGLAEQDLGIPCKSLGLKRSSIPRRMLVGDSTREWIAKEILPTSSLSSVLSALRPALEPMAALNRVQMAGMDPLLQQKQMEAQRQQETERREREKADLEEKRRRDEARVALEKQKAEELERARIAVDQEKKRLAEEEERFRLQQIQLERIKREEEERLAQIEQEKKRKREEEERNERRRNLEIARSKALQNILDIVVPAVETRRLLRKSTLRWKQTAQMLHQEYVYKASRVVLLRSTLVKRRFLRAWQRTASIQRAVLIVARLRKRMVLRRFWSLLASETSSRSEHRQRRFQRSLLPVIDAFPTLNHATDSNFAIVAAGGARMARQLSTTAEVSASSLVSSPTLRGKATTPPISLPAVNIHGIVDRLFLSHPERRYIKVCAVTFDPANARLRDYQSDVLCDWVLRPMYEDGRVVLSHVSFCSLVDVRDSVAGADVVVVLRNKTAGGEDRAFVREVLQVANSSVASGSACFVPVVQVALAEVWLDMDPDVHGDGENERATAQMDVVLDSVDHCENLRRMEKAWEWAMNICFEKVQRVRIKEVAFESFILTHLPRFKWSRFRSPSEWLTEGVRLVVEAASRLESASLECCWPPKDVDDYSTVPYDWNSKARVEAQTQQMIQCVNRIPTSGFSMEDVGIFAEKVGLKLSALEALMVAARGDGLWLWEQLVCGLIQSLVPAHCVVFEVVSDHNSSRVYESLSMVLREPPNWMGANRRSATLTNSKKRTRSSHGISAEAVRDEMFEQTLKKYLQQGANRTAGEGLYLKDTSSSPVSSPTKTASKSIIGMDVMETVKGLRAVDVILERAKIERARENDFLNRLSILKELR